MEHSEKAYNCLYVCTFSFTTHFCTEVCLMVTMVTCIRNPFLMSSKSSVFLKQICLKIHERVPVVFKGLWSGCAREIDRLSSKLPDAQLSEKHPPSEESQILLPFSREFASNHCPRPPESILSRVRCVYM